MINEEMLKAAAAEADRAIIDSLPAPVECEHVFSQSFQRKMHRTFRKAKYPAIYTLSKYAACFILAAALVGSTWLTVDAEARVSFSVWMRKQYEAFVEYRFVGEAPEDDEISVYELTWLPEGFSLQDEQELGGSTYLTYFDASGQRIIFACLRGDDATSLFVMSDYEEIRSVQVGSITADFYQAAEENSSNMLVWSSEENDIVFFIMSDLPEDTMIKMAESVQEKISEKD